MPTDTTPTLRAVPDPARPRTDAEDKLWQALLANAGSTAAALSTAAGIGKSTAPKILARWANDGLVTRTAGIADGGSRSADRWSITPDDEPDNQPADEQPTGDEPTGDRSTDDQPGGDAHQPAKPGRLASGALRGMIEDYLREHSGEEFSPNAVGRALTRSAGAVHNALEKLVETGYAVRTSNKPKKYSLATDPAAAAAE
ncbi:MarR family transcriptional regulator [Saccharothrix syringae]|uniref:MarR family transcriptional regulator n=2 Tax=Saccharothrix syringae TaxID=103733 RepID=A0A5Q0HD48_SACSY|nr:MarR family transcriptional regulator [Saccharothrix syringae]